METNHTFLFTDGVWNAKGFYFDENEKSFSVEGKLITEQTDEHWRLEILIKSIGDDSIDFKNSFTIIPFKEKSVSTSWTSLNNEIGQLLGNFLTQGEYIISLFESEDKEYSGTEYFIFRNDSHYRYRGVIFNKEKKYSSWTVELKKI